MLRKEIIRYLSGERRPVRERELRKGLRIRGREHGMLRAILKELVAEKRIVRLEDGRYVALSFQADTDDPGAEVTLIVREAGLPEEFPGEVEEEARNIASTSVSADSGERLDLRERVVLTIDPADAMDFDDAVSIESHGEDGWTIGVHIADVSHYVQAGSPLDTEAWYRGTSVYLVDRVIPMLPEALSNGVCSLQPGEEKLTFSCFITLDTAGRTRESQLADSVIRSRARLTYEQAQAIIETGGDPSGDASPEVVAAVREMAGVARLLTRKRIERGTIDFDLPEPIVELDESGIPLSLRARPRLASHRLIEEFMILANEVVAEYADNLGMPFIYRVHEEPDPEQMQEFARFVASFDLPRLKGSGATPRALNTILEKVEGTQHESIINKVLLRHMKQALYGVENIGHFGLASRSYCHFTSPIRRYPDLIVHRQLRQYREIAPTGGELEELEKWLRDTAEQSTERERIAMEAERDSVKLKQIAYMERHVGDVFRGIISGVTGFGLFVELERLLVDGLVHISELDDDYYIHEEERYRLTGERTGKQYRLGDPLYVQVVRADRIARQLDLIPVPEEEGAENEDR